MKPKIVVIVGPTAVGKSSISVELAKKFNAEIVSADSVQIYRGLNIGSAKISEKEMQGVKHHLIDILEPTDEFNASDYGALAREKISEILGRNKNVIVVGGTGMYVNALLFDFSIDCPKDDAYRAELKKIAETEGKDRLYEILREVDPRSAEVIDKNQTLRIIRALEIFHLTGKRKSEFYPSVESPYNYLLIGLSEDRETLYRRINNRVDQMLKAGLIDEVKALIENGVKEDSQSMRAIGYKETISYLKGEYTGPEFIEKLKQNTRNYAKRQITYFKKMKGIIFVEDREKIFELVRNFYDK